MQVFTQLFLKFLLNSFSLLCVMPASDSCEEAELRIEVAHIAFCRTFWDTHALRCLNKLCCCELSGQCLPECQLGLSHGSPVVAHDHLIVGQQM